MANPIYFRPTFDQLANSGVLGVPAGKLAYAYMRVSGTDQSDEGRSGFPRQLSHIHEIATARGYSIPWENIYADDHTGFEFEQRPALTELRRLCKSGVRKANAVVIEALDRLSREATWHQGFLIDEMQKYGLEVIFWKEVSSRIERAVMGAVAQEGMEQAKKRMAQGNLHKARSGRVTARVPAYGYKLVDSEGNEGASARKDTYYAINEVEAAVVRMMYEKVAAGQTMRGLAHEMDAAGIPPPKRSKSWEPTQIRIIIKNEVYKGDFYAHRWHHTEVQKLSKDGVTLTTVKRKVERPREEWIHVPVPPIVTEELWETTNRMLIQNKRMARRNASQPYLLTGLIKCARCGATYTGSTKRKSRGKTKKVPYRAYRCPSNGIRPKHVVEEDYCGASQIQCVELDGAVWHVVCDALLQPDVMLNALDNDATSMRNQQLLEQLAYLEKQTVEREGYDGKLLKAYLAGAFDEEEFAEQRQRVKAEMHRIQEEIHALNQQIITTEQLKARKADIIAMSEHIKEANIPVDPPFDLKQRIVKILIDEIVLDVAGGTIEVQGVLRGKFMFENTSADTDS